jgi:hypothetical protein
VIDPGTGLAAKTAAARKYGEAERGFTETVRMSSGARQKRGGDRERGAAKGVLGSVRERRQQRDWVAGN